MQRQVLRHHGARLAFAKAREPQSKMKNACSNEERPMRRRRCPAHGGSQAHPQRLDQSLCEPWVWYWDEYAPLQPEGKK